MEMDDGIAVAFPREHILFQAYTVIAYDGVGDSEDIGCGPVVLVEDYVPFGVETQEDVRTGAPPFIDGLVRISHDKEVAADFGQGLDDVPLSGIAVLGLVHHDVTELLLPFGTGVRKIVEYMTGKGYKVVIIKGKLVHLAVEQLYVQRKSGPVGRNIVRHDVVLYVGLAFETRQSLQQRSDRLYRTFLIVRPKYLAGK